MAAGGEIKNIASLISNNEIFEVPDFQRNYAWDKKQVEELFYDILEARNSQSDHFMGSLILQRSLDVDNRKMLVVDGQQRLTTLFILVAVIRDAANKLSIREIPDERNYGAPIQVTYAAHEILVVDGAPRFIAHPLIAAMAQGRIFAFPVESRPKMPLKHYKFTLKLRTNYKRLQELVAAELNELQNDEERLMALHVLLQTIKHKLKMLEVTADTTSEAYEIFMTLNSRGLPLGPSDLVKSEIFKHLTEGLTETQMEAKSSQLSGEWKMIVDSLEAGDLDQFIRHFMVSTEPGSVTAKKVHDKVALRIKGTPQHPKNKRDESQTLLRELVHVAEIYGQVLEGETPWLNEADVTLRPKTKLSLQLLADLTDSYRIFLMVVCDPEIGLDKEQRAELIRLTEVIGFRWVIAGLNAQKLEDIFQKLALSLRDDAPFGELVDLIANNMPQDDQIRREFDDVIESTTLVRTVLFRINRAKWEPSAALAYSTKSFHVEHIAPDKPTPHWMDKLFPSDESERDVEYDAAVELWGNKTLLERKINQSVKQKPFEEKQSGVPGNPPAGFEGYVNSNFKITKEIGELAIDWNRDEIALRNKWIADCFIKVYGVTENLDSVVTFEEWRKSHV